MDAAKLAGKIAARKADGLSAAEANAAEGRAAVAKENAGQWAIREAIAAGLSGDDGRIDRALARCRELGVA